LRTLFRGKGISVCRIGKRVVGWACEKASLFVAAATYVKAVSQSVRPDLEQVDPDLDLTTAKFDRVLEKIKEVLDVGLFEQVEPLGAKQAQALVDLVKKKRTERKRQLVSWFRSRDREKCRLLAERPVFPAYEPVAAAAAAETDRRDRRVDLVAEDGSWKAIINLPDPRFAAPGEKVRLLVRKAPKNATRAFVCGKSAGLEREGGLLVAVFAAGDLREAWKRSDVPTVALELEDGVFVGAVVVPEKK
jgi:hypothetical protein